LLGKPEPEPVEPQIADSDYGPPPPAIDKRFTGRIRLEWKGNNGQP